MSENIGEKDTPVTSIEEFFEALRNINRTRTDAAGETDKDLGKQFNLGSFFLFRGVPTEDFTLVGRIDYDKHALRPRIIERIREIDEKYELKKAHASEFVEAVEKQVFASFKGRARIYQQIEPKDDWEWLALARHYGVPTRLMDWSRDPQIALWFAVTDNLKYRDSDAVVYVFEPRERFFRVDNEDIYNLHYGQNTAIRHPFDIDTPEFREKAQRAEKSQIVLYRPPSITERIEYQSSWFSVHPFDVENDRYLPFELEKGKAEGYLKPIYIKYSHKFKIRRELKFLGIDESSIYKDLDHLGLYLKNRYFKMGDEIFSDESLAAGRIIKTFRKLQSSIGLYNSCEVKRIEYKNVKAVYQQLITMLCDKKGKITQFWTFNNMNREFINYRPEREVYLRLAESLFSQHSEIYKRIQFFIYGNGNTPAGYSCEDLIFDCAHCWTDDLSKHHARHFNANTRYAIYDYAQKKEQHEICGFVLVEREVTENGQTKKEKNLIVEFNHDLLKKIVHRSNSMCFWLKFSDEAEVADKKHQFLDVKENAAGDSETAYSIYHSFSDYFEKLFNQPVSTGSPAGFPVMRSHDYIERLCKDHVEKLKREYNREYLRVYYNYINKKGEQAENCIFIPLNTWRISLINFEAFISYLYYQTRNHLNIARDAYGKTWQLMQKTGENMKPVEAEDYLAKSVAGALKYDHNHFFGQKLEELGLICFDILPAHGQEGDQGRRKRYYSCGDLELVLLT